MASDKAGDGGGGGGSSVFQLMFLSVTIGSYFGMEGKNMRM